MTSSMYTDTGRGWISVEGRPEIKIKDDDDEIYLLIEGERAIGTKDKNILWFKKIGKKRVEVALYNIGEASAIHIKSRFLDLPPLSPKVTYKIRELHKVLSKSSPIKQCIEILFADSIPDYVRQTINRNLGVVQDRFTDPSNPLDPRDPLSAGVRTIEGKRKDEALALLKDPALLDVIDGEIQREIVGEKTNRKFLFLSLIQSFTEEYPQITLIGESSVGKTYLVNHVLQVFPPELYKKFGRLSKTAMERAEELLTGVRIVYIQESRGGRASADSIRLSSSSDGGMIALVTNAETGRPDQFKLNPLTIISTQTELTLFHEDDTRNTRIYLDSSISQTKGVIKYQAQEAEFPGELKEDLGIENPSKAPVIQDAIRLLHTDLKIIIPYQTLIADILGASKIRVKRDHKKFIGIIKASALLHQYQRDVIDTGNNKYIIANADDLKNALTFGEKAFTDSYYNLDEQDRIIIGIIKELEKGREAFGLTSDEICKAVKEKIGRGRTWTMDRLKRLRDNSIIQGERIDQTNGFSRILYRSYDIDFKSILKGNIKWIAVAQKTEQWRKGLEAYEGAVTITKLS